MRLLRTYGSGSTSWQPQLTESRGEKYAILSHRWLADGNDEVLFSDIRTIDDGGPSNPKDDKDIGRHTRYRSNPSFSGRSIHQIRGYSKLRGAAQEAFKQGHHFIWIDTCCIDKSSSAELSEAINSMYKWYQEAETCLAYLVDVPDGPRGLITSNGSPFALSRWWSRGWTLQELVAPPRVLFYTQGWELIGEKVGLGQDICAISGIGVDVLSDPSVLNQTSIARRMSWASSRKTSRPEDRAYSLMGIFNVNMPLLYGEGDRAFLRLQEEIMKHSDDESIFAWINPTAKDDEPSGLLAERPAYFSGSGEVIYYQDFEDQEPYVMTNRGLSISCHLSNCKDGTFAAAINCPMVDTGDGFIAIFLKRQENTRHYMRVKCSQLGSLQTRGATEKIYVRQNQQVPRQNKVLPYHFFSLRHLFGRHKNESLKLLQVVEGPPYEFKNVVPPFPTSHSRKWIRDQPGTFRVVRGEGRLSAALLFGNVFEEAKMRNRMSAYNLVIVMIGSISNTEVGFDAHGANHLLDFDSMDRIFQPKPAGQWIDVFPVQVKVDFEPQVNGSSQLFLTDVTIEEQYSTFQIDNI